MKVSKKNQTIKLHRINKEIYSKKVRLTGIKNEQIGIINLQEALKKSKELGMDLVEISPNSKPPVCKIMDYGKFLYKKNKAAKIQKKKQKIIQIKEIKFRPNTDINDYKIKLKNLIKFLKEGDKVKITVRFRGREMAHQKLGINVLNRIRKDLIDISILEFFPKKVESRQATMILSPKKNVRIN